MIRIFQRKPSGLTPEQILDRLKTMENLCPTNAELQVLGPAMADRQAQRLQVTLNELWLVQTAIKNQMAAQEAFREALFNSQAAAAIAN
jgi:hypothetical protein